MKLLTHIKPRTDGTVIFVGDDGEKYTFRADADADGVMTCDVEDEATLTRLLGLQNFEPADEADYEKANALAGSAKTDTDPDDGDDLDDDLPPDLNALPVEANTPRKPAPMVQKGAKPRKPRKPRNK